LIIKKINKNNFEKNKKNMRKGKKIKKRKYAWNGKKNEKQKITPPPPIS
jgi:hypothetical protein